MVRWIIPHWRLTAAVAVGFLAFVLTHVWGAPTPARPLIAWNAGAVTYAVLLWSLFISASEVDVRARAAATDEGRGVLTLLVVAAIGASLGAIVAALIQIKGESAATRNLVAALAALTLITSWVGLQSVFVLHYAHRHFADIEAYGDAAGFIFPGDAPRTYLDFAYLAVCVGATAQISDPSIPSTRLRNLVTAHAVASFFYNTAVLALGINILSGLIPH